MNLWSGLQTLLGGDSSSTKSNPASGAGALHQREEALVKKNAKLKEQLDEANARIAELENQIGRMKEESTKVEQNFDLNKEDDRQTAEATVPVQDMIQSLEEKLQQLEVKTDRQMRQLSESVDRQMTQIKGSAEQMDRIEVAVQPIATMSESVGQLGELQNMTGQMDACAETLKTELADKIHTEDVKCYRNIKSLLTDMEVKMEQMELGEESLRRIRKSFKGIKFFSFFALLDFAAIVVFILYYMGYIVLP